MPGGIASRYPRISERFTAAALDWPMPRENAFRRQRSSESVWGERRSVICRQKKFSQSCCTVRFDPLPIPSLSKRRHASKSSAGSYFSDWRITPKTCFSSTASSASSTEPLRLVSSINFCACSFVAKNRRYRLRFSDNLAGTHTR